MFDDRQGKKGRAHLGKKNVVEAKTKAGNDEVTAFLGDDTNREEGGSTREKQQESA